MSEPDIIIDITGTDLQAWVWIESVEVTRQGREVCPGTGDCWRLSLPLRASLARNGALILDDQGNELPALSPLKSVSVDVAKLIHHPEVAALLTQLRDTTIRIARGTLQAAP